MTAVTDQDPTEHTTKEAARPDLTGDSGPRDDRDDRGREDRGDRESRGDDRAEQNGRGDGDDPDERGRRGDRDDGHGRGSRGRGDRRGSRDDREEWDAQEEQGDREGRGSQGGSDKRGPRDDRGSRDSRDSRAPGDGQDGRDDRDRRDRRDDRDDRVRRERRERRERGDSRDGRGEEGLAEKAALRERAGRKRVGRERATGDVPDAGDAGRGRRQRERGSERIGDGSHARVPDDLTGAHRRAERAEAPVGGSVGGPAGGPAASGDGGGGGEEVWGDGLIARRVDENAGAEQFAVVPSRPASSSAALMPLAYDGNLRSRLDALRELVGLSRTRLDSATLAEAGRVLDEAAARRRLSGQHTVVAIAGATGSGKSQLFNTLAGVTISETGVRRPTTAAPIACSWSDGAASLLDRLGIPGRLRRRPLQHPDSESPLRGLVLIDLPDHDSAAVQHREQVDRILALVDAVIWVVDPEKYADAVLHERYLRPMAGHAEVTLVVLNQVDRLPGEAAEQVLDDLRRLLDEDGIALGEYGEPGAAVLALSALTGEGVGELRETLGQFVAERQAPARRIAADVDAAARHLRPVYVAGRRTGLSEEAREEFADRLADAVGATAAGEAAERAWLRNANRACGTPWLRLWRWYHDRRDPITGRLSTRAQTDEEATARQRVEQAVRTVADRASAGLPAPWALAMREAAVRGAQGLPEALDELAVRSGLPPGRPPRPGWWPVAVLAQATMTLLQVVGGLWLLGQIIGVVPPNLGVPVLLMVAGIVGGPLIEWSCRLAARGPARRYGHEAERLLREAAAGCGRARVLDPLAAELLRYREVREQYARVTGAGLATGAGAGATAGTATR
ncbi:ATP-binding protein [Streptomyces anthocyanicus]|uniref:YfjP family GTPase n=2 Tax=Streptomyces anthocyanicus TaxID=68174 RepID=UPI001671400A|nr:YfjP family GTPase [Streptomyces anthocyanicus]GGL27336.1 ATP-binding protein [Streptomyces anthocyanicus]